MVGRPALQRPVLVAAFRGWNDGGQGATLAAGYLAKIWGAERFADIDPENFIDFQANRPHVSLDEGLTRRIEWPENAFYHARIPGTTRDVVLLLALSPACAGRRSASSSSTWRATWTSSCSSPSARCWPTCRTRAPPR